MFCKNCKMFPQNHLYPWQTNWSLFKFLSNLLWIYFWQSQNLSIPSLSDYVKLLLNYHQRANYFSWWETIKFFILLTRINCGNWLAVLMSSDFYLKTLLSLLFCWMGWGLFLHAKLNYVFLIYLYTLNLYDPFLGIVCDSVINVISVHNLLVNVWKRRDCE